MAADVKDAARPQHGGGDDGEVAENDAAVAPVQRERVEERKQAEEADGDAGRAARVSRSPRKSQAPGITQSGVV